MEKTTADTYLTIALADYDLRQLRIEKLYLEDKEPRINCRCYTCGSELLNDLRSGIGCDVVVLGSALADMSDADFLLQLRGVGSNPFLLLNAYGSGGKSTASCIRENGSGYAAWDSNLELLLNELYRISGRSHLSFEEQCRQMYAEWGARGNDINCDYLTSVLRIVCNSEHHLALRKELMQAVSDEYNVSVAAIDSGLRRLVEECETRGTDGWLEFKRAGGFESMRPTIGRFIYAAKEQLMLRGAVVD